MIRDVPARATTIWSMLIVATCITWWLGDRHAVGGWAIATIIALGFAKIYLVGTEFMELRHAPALLRAAFTAWIGIVGACSAVLAYL